MADTKISALTAVANAATTNELAVNESGTSKKVTLAQIAALLYPVGSIYISTASTNPNTLFGFGTWAAFGAGKVLVGLDSGDTAFDTSEETGGAKTHTLQTTEIPSHSHVISQVRSATTGAATTNIARTSDTSSTAGSDISTDAAGGGQAHNNLQPYIVVYMFKRTA